MSYVPELKGRELGSSDEGKAARLRKDEPVGVDLEPNQIVRQVRQIPVELWRAVQDDVLEYLKEEITLADSERGDFITKIARWKHAYRAPVASSPKHFPIWNASNLTYPLIKETVNTMAAQIAQSVLVVRPRWVLKDLAAEWKPFVDPIENFLDIASERDMNLKRVAVPWLIEGAKLGTSMLELGYDVDVRRIYKYTPDGKDAYPSRITRRDGPRALHFPLQDFWIRFGEYDEQEARWCARRMLLTERELREAEAQGKFFNLAALEGRQVRGTDPSIKLDEDVERTRPNQRDLWEVFKVWLSWDVDGDGINEELLLYFSRDALSFLSKKFNPYWHGRRPYVKFKYFPVEHRFYGEGLCEMLEDLQDGISAMHNRRADNHTLANSAMILKRKMSKGILPGDPLYPGKIIETADIWNDIREFRLSEPYQSTVQEEAILRQIADNLAGMSDAQRGSAMPVSRTTAAAQLALLQEQAKRVDLTVQSARDSLDEVGLFAVNLYYQFGTNGKALEWMGERGRIVEAVFRLPKRVVEIGQALRVSTPTSLQNRQVKRENAIALFNLLVQMYERIMPLAQLITPEQLPEVAHAMVSSANRFMQDVLETFEVTDAEDVLAGLTVLEKILPAPQDLGGMESFRRSTESAEIIDKISRLEDIYREAAASRGGVERLLGEGADGTRVAARQGVPGGGSPGTGLGGGTHFRSGGGR